MGIKGGTPLGGRDLERVKRKELKAKEVKRLNKVKELQAMNEVKQRSRTTGLRYEGLEGRAWTTLGGLGGG